MWSLKTLSCFTVLALAAAFALPSEAEAAAAPSPGSLAERISQVTEDPVQLAQRRSWRDRRETRSRRATRRHPRAERPRAERRRPDVRRPYTRRYVPRYHGPRYRARRPGFHFYGGWWYAFPWWLGVTDRCEYWHQQCVYNWGYSNPNYRGCMRYHQCVPW